MSRAPNPELPAPPESAFSLIKPTRASSDVIAQVREAILSGRFRPGDRLPTEREMAAQFGVSRVTVRDALRALEAGGLIRIKVGGQGGPFVAEPDIAQLSSSLGTHLQLRGVTLRELAEARLALETTAARLAADRATPDDLAALERAILGPPSPAVGTAASSLDFHTALVAAAHNQALLTMFSATRALMQEALDALHASQPDMAAAARAAHTALVEAIAAHDGERAGLIMRDHLHDFIARAERRSSRSASIRFA